MRCSSVCGQPRPARVGDPAAARRWSRLRGGRASVRRRRRSARSRPSSGRRRRLRPRARRRSRRGSRRGPRGSGPRSRGSASRRSEPAPGRAPRTARARPDASGRGRASRPRRRGRAPRSARSRAPRRARMAPGDEPAGLDDGRRTHGAPVCRATPSGWNVSSGSAPVPIARTWRHLDVTAAELRDRALVLAHELGVDPAAWYVRVLEEEQRAGSSPISEPSCGLLGAPAGHRPGRSQGHLAAPRRPALVRRSAAACRQTRLRRSPGHTRGGLPTSQLGAAVLPAGPLGLPWPVTPWPPALRPPPRPLGVLDPRRGVPDPGARREGRAARDAGRLAHRPRLARRCGAALPGGREGRRQADHRLRGLRRRRPPRADEGVRAPDAPRRVERGLREPHQALLARLPRGLLLQAARRLGAPRAPREGHRRALGLPLRPRLACALREPPEGRGRRPRPARPDLRA